MGDVVESIIEEEFGSLNFQTNIAAAVIDDMANWKTADAKAAFTKEASKAIDRLRGKVKDLFKGEFKRTTRPFTSSVKQASELPEQLFDCAFSFEIMENPVIALDGHTCKCDG